MELLDRPFDDVTVVQDRGALPERPLVSVCIVTYEQEEYIAEALDSVLAQDTDFPFEIIVGDDHSTDGTRSILQRYQQNHPERIVLNLHEEHYDGIPARKNMVTNLNTARGKYIALLDGDDFWISTDKLQRQADFLAAHPDVSFSFHDAVSAWPSGRGPKDATSGAEQRFSTVYAPVLEESRFFAPEEIVHWHAMARSFAVPAGSVMFPRNLFMPIPRWFRRVWNADKAMQLHFSQHGPAYYHKDLLCYYRRNNPTSMGDRFRDSVMRSDHHIRQIDVYCQVAPAYAAYRHYERYRRYRTRTRIELKRGNYRTALAYFRKGLMAYLRDLR